MEIYTTQAINLLGSVLVQARIMHLNGDNTPVTGIIPEFAVEKFLSELRELMVFESYEDEDDLRYSSPLVYQYLYEKADSGSHFDNLYGIEIDWAIDMGIPPAFPRYIQGYEIK